jgi:hypothetical protein
VPSSSLVRPRRRTDAQSTTAATPKDAHLRRLRDAAWHAVLGGRYFDALGYCRQLEQIEPDDPEWARRTAYCCHRLGMRAGEVAALLRAAEGYERAGFTRKAAAMYRLVAALDPSFGYVHRRIDDLAAGQGTGLESLPPRALSYLTESEAPPPALASPARAGESATTTQPAAAPVSVAAQGADDTERLVDEYALIEFADTDIIAD